MNKDLNKTLPVFTGSVNKNVKFKNKITINKDVSKDSLFGFVEKKKEEKYILPNIYCDFVKTEKQDNIKVDSIHNSKIELDKKIGKTTETYRFKSPFLKL